MRTMQTFQTNEDHFAGPEAEVAGGFAGQQDKGFTHQSPCQHDALLLAPGSFPCAVYGARVKPNFIQPRSPIRSRFAVRNFPDRHWHHHVFA